MKKILFVCTGNSCRSPMAEGLLEKMLEEKGIQNIEVFSAGINPVPGEPPARDAIEVLRREGVDISNHRGAYITYDLISQADLILVMGKTHKEKILAMGPQVKGRIFLLREFAGDWTEDENLDITDPIGQPISVYEKCLLEIKNALKKALPKIIEMVEEPDGNSNRK